MGSNSELQVILKAKELAKHTLIVTSNARRYPKKYRFGGEMAHIEVWVRCPICNKICDTFSEAIKCRDSHPIHSERWAVGKNGAAYRIQEHSAPGSFGSEELALKKADE